MVVQSVRNVLAKDEVLCTDAVLLFPLDTNWSYLGRGTLIDTMPSSIRMPTDKPAEHFLD